MTPLPHILFDAEAEADLAAAEGTVIVFAAADGTLTPAATALDAAMGGALTRALAEPGVGGKPGVAESFGWPAGLAARRVLLACLGADPDAAAARKTGGAIAKALAKGPATLATAGLGDEAPLADLVMALALRLYDFRAYKKSKPAEGDEPEQGPRTIRVLSDRPEALAGGSRAMMALAEGVFFTRDLVNEPANVLTTDEFAARLAAMQEIGLDVEILGEPELQTLGMRALLGVGQGSASETKVVVMRWMGGGQEAPFALVGKGVVFDTGGISLKPASGMEDMTMDMGGAGTVAGVMRTLALRKARANVVGVVGLVENMPDGTAQRPGDIVRSMKGDTIEIINTDAEGRLLLADVLWYVQQTFKPTGIVDLATLTGAVIIALGHHRAGYYATDDALAADLEAACAATGDETWRLPLGKPYAEQLKSAKADLKNTGGRSAGSVTAAEFLHAFVEDGVPWIHIDIAGTATTSAGTDMAPKGATGWGVAALDRLVRTRLEPEG
ncbi:MAG: leucyl aminopeptidase [Pseudomonadota bacterium]